LEDSTAAPPRRRARPPRRPQRQQILVRRGLALGGALIVLILIVLGIKGCLDARKERELTGYARDVSQIVEETQQTSKAFFGKLSNPGSLSATEFINEVNADRSAMDNYAARVNALGAPGDMGHAQGSLELVYELRESAMDGIAGKMSKALGHMESKQASEAIALQMRKLLAGDELYAAVTKPEIDGVLASEGIEGSDVPASVFLPEDTKWLDPVAVETALGQVSGSGATAETPGVHGMGLLGASLGGTELVPESTTAVAAGGTPELEVQVENQGESAESSVTVSVTVNGGSALQQTISSIEAHEMQTVTIPLTPAPRGRATLEVDVATVPGEQVSSNNKASYTVEIE
jgi:CARDB